MFQKDYILRMAEEIAKVMAYVLGLVERKDLQQAMQVMDESLLEKLDTDPEWLMEIPQEKLLHEILKDGVIDEPRWKHIAALLSIKSKVYELLDQEDLYYEALNRQLLIQLALFRHQKGVYSLDLVHKIEFAISELDRERCSYPLRLQLFYYHWEQEQYDRAENQLYELKEQSGGNKLLHKTGIQFYTDLLKLSDQALNVGKLPRTEVIQGLAEWRSIS